MLIFQKVNPSSDPFYRVTMHDPKIWSVLNNDVYYVPNGRNAQYCYMFMITNFIHVNPTRDEMQRFKIHIKLNQILSLTIYIHLFLKVKKCQCGIKV